MEKASFGVVVVVVAVAALSVCRSLGLMRVCRTTVQLRCIFMRLCRIANGFEFARILKRREKKQKGRR